MYSTVLNRAATRCISFGVLIVCGLLAGCEQEAQSNAINSDNSSVTNAVLATAWSGEAYGYVSIETLPVDRIELFIRLGRLSAALSLYLFRAQNLGSDYRSMDGGPSAERISSDRELVASTLDARIIDSTAEIEPKIKAKMRETKQQFALQELLIELTKPQQIADLMSRDRSQREKQMAARQKVLTLHSRIHSAVLAFFPSRHEYLLASSGLIREAGDDMALAVSAKGMVLDAHLLQKASELIYRSRKLDPKNISYCESQREPMRAHKEARNQLLDKMLPLELGAKLSVTATEVYHLAKQAQTSGVRFPIVDNTNCD